MREIVCARNSARGRERKSVERVCAREKECTRERACKRERVCKGERVREGEGRVYERGERMR